MSDVKDIEAAVAVAEAETGIRGNDSNLRVCRKTTNQRARAWTEKESEFVRKNLGHLSEGEIGRQLGRTALSIRNHWKRELHLCAPSKASENLTGEHISVGLGCDGKTIHRLIDTGLMPGRRLATNGRVIRLVDRVLFLRWLCNPKHWLYFKPDRIGTLRFRGKRRIGDYYDYAFWEEARELVLPAFKKWKDQWLTPMQVARHLGVVAYSYSDGKPQFYTRYINYAIRKGNLKATRWGNWWILKSDLPERGMTINFQGKFVRL